MLRRVTRRWRRSIQVRVVSSTLVVSAIVVALLGFVVLEQVKQGLIQAKLRSSVAEEQLGVSNARTLLARQSGALDVQAVLQQVVQALSPVQGGREGGYEVVGYELVTGTNSRTNPALNNGLIASSVPQSDRRGQRELAVLLHLQHWCTATSLAGGPQFLVVSRARHRQFDAGAGQQLQHLPVLLPVLPATATADARARRAHAPAQWHRPRRVAGRHRVARHPPSRDAGTDGSPHRRTACRRAPAGADDAQG